jgi:uncharacterized protein
MLEYSQDVKKYDWLQYLLKAYTILDTARPARLKNEEFRRKKRVACQKGCQVCCTNQEIQLTDIELMGISWFLSEKLQDRRVRETMKERFRNYTDLIECPFLFEQQCVVYEMRPLACRGYYVFGEKCEPGINMETERPNDIFFADQIVAKKASMPLLKYYGFQTEKQRERAFDEGFIFLRGRSLHSMPLEALGTAMERFEISSQK